MEWDFFISYQRDVNQPFALELYDALSPRHRVFLDLKVLQPGCPWGDDIIRALRVTRVNLIVLSGADQVPVFLREEISRALDLYDKEPKNRRVVPIFPFGIPGQEGFPAGLFSLQAINTKDCKLVDLIPRLEGILAATPAGVLGQAPAAVQPVAPAAQKATTHTRSITLEFTLRIRFEEFDKEAFSSEVARAFGVERALFMIRAVLRGSVVVVVDGDAKVLGGMVSALAAHPTAPNMKRLVRELQISNVRARTEEGDWRIVEVPPLEGRSVKPAAAGSRYRGVRLDFTPWSVIQLRSALDEVFLESEVVAVTLDALRTLPGAKHATLWLSCRPQATLCRFSDRAGSGPRDDGSGDQRAHQSYSQREFISGGSTEPGLEEIFVPLEELDAAVGCAQLTVSRVQWAPFVEGAERFFRALGAQVGAAIRRARSLRAQRDISRTTAQALVIDRLFDSLLDEITSLGFDYAAISIADHFRGDIGILRAKNMPAAWAAAATHPLDHWDIVPDTYRSRTSTGVLEGWDKRFDAVLFARFGHAELVRVFTPILHDGCCLGVVEYGCERTKRQTQFTAERMDQVDEILARRAQPEFALARPYVLLEKIAEHAADALGADAAAIYIYETSPERRPLGEPILAAGAGKATAEFVKRFAPRTDGIGHQALLARVQVPLGELEVKDQNPALYDAGVRALVVEPLLFGIHGDDDQRHVGLLYVDFRAAPHHFTGPELQATSLLARQAEIAIANTLLIDRVKETYRRAPRYSRLLEILKSIPETNLTHVLTQIVKNILRLLGAHNVVLYEYRQHLDQFTKPIKTGHFFDPVAMDQPMPSDGVARGVLESGQSRFVEDMNQERDLLSPRPGRTRFAIRENIRASAALVLKDRDEVLGILFVNYRQPVQFSQSDQSELQTLASSAAIALRSSRQRELEEARRKKELDALRAVEAAISQADLQSFASVLELILDKAMDLIAVATSGVIMLANPMDQTLSTISARGFPKGFKLVRDQRLSEGIVGLAGTSKESQLVRDVTQAASYKNVLADTKSELAVPIVDGDRLVGVINFESVRLGAFTEVDKAQLESLACQVVIVMRCIQRFQEPIAPKRALHLVRDAMHSNLGRDARLRLVLTAITAGQGLGFSRAMVFGWDGKQAAAIVALGALTRAEAEAVWDRVDGELRQWKVSNRVAGERPVSEAERVLSYLFDCAVSVALSMDSKPILSPLEELLKRLDLSGDDECPSALMQCARTGEPCSVSGEEVDPLRSRLREAAGDGVWSDMLFIPLAYQGAVTGVLVVDSEFLPQAQHPPMRARFRTGSEHSLLEVLKPFADLLGTVLVNSSGR